MAPIEFATYFGANPAPKVAAMTGLVSVALYVDLPELGLLGGLVVYAMASGKGHNTPQWLESIASKTFVDALPAQSLVLLFAGLFLASVTGMFVQFALALLSALAYIVLYELGKRQQGQQVLKKKTLVQEVSHAKLSPWRRRSTEASDKIPPASPKAAKPESTPMVVPRVVRTGLDGEIQELVESGMATRKNDAVVRELMRLARKCLLPVVPEAEITVLPSGNLELIGSSGAKPEVDMVITIDADILADRLKTYFLKGQTRIRKSLDTLAPELLQKTATKVLSERLTFVRFWRSQFSGPEPMIVLLIPVELGFFNYPVRLNFSVNTPYPLRLATLLSKENMRTKELILLVTRWALERCIANTSRGQPHAYAWGLMVIYFLKNVEFAGEKTAAELFKKFVVFYGEWFEQRGEPVSVRFSAKSAQPTPESALWGVPSIEDPFDATKDAGSSMTADGVARLKDEFTRAREMLTDESKVKLSDLMERWVPPAQPSS